MASAPVGEPADTFWDRTIFTTCAIPGGSYSEYACYIDYIACDQNWEAGDHKPEDTVYLWGPALPEDFVVNYEVPVAVAQGSQD